MPKCLIDTKVEVTYTTTGDLLFQAWTYNLKKWYTSRDEVYRERAIACERALIVLALPAWTFENPVEV